MQVGDLVVVSPRIENSYVNRVGIILAKVEQKRCFVVQFFDSLSPSRCSYHVRVIRRVSE